MKLKKLLSLALAIVILLTLFVFADTAVSAEDYPSVIPYTSHYTAYVGSNVTVKFKLFHAYYDERLYVDVYNSKDKIVASATDYFDENDADEQIYTFTWLAKNNPAGDYYLIATASYWNGEEWVLAPEDELVAITLKNIPSPKLKSAKNVKGKKITAKWRSVNKATKYQVKIGSKLYTTKKISYTAKKLNKGKTYAVKVRSYMNKHWSKWSKTKKVKVTK